MMWMMLWMLPFWVAVAVGSVWFFTNGRRGSGSDAIELLRQRLARGEIDADEFERRDEVLKRRDGRGRPRERLIALGIALAVMLFVVVPVIAMAVNGWDMWDMHGRGRDTSGSAVVRAGLQSTVSIRGFAFDPGNLEVPVGATVTWTNQDSAPHDATARNGAWKTERLSRDESGRVTFDAVGEYDYYCSIHSGMAARLVVR